MQRLVLAGLLALSVLALPLLAHAQTQGALNPYLLSLDRGTKTATASAGAATLNKASGVITTESLTTAAGAVYTLTLTDSVVLATDQCFASIQLGTSTTGTPALTGVKPTANTLTIFVQNIHASAAFNGTLKISFMCLRL